MSFIEIFFIGIGLAMDAFAVSICKGLSMKKINYKKAEIVGLYFGVFQAGMVLIGDLLGNSFEEFIKNIDHWVAFFLLVCIGINMIREVFQKEESYNDDVSFKTMVPLALATSIDALACGITFACLSIKIAMPSITIGIITFVLSFIGVAIGKKFGNKFKTKAQILGGAILILLGIKILLEHLGIIQF